MITFYNHHSYRIMKLTALWILLGTLHLSAVTRSQTITLALENSSIKRAFTAIQAQTGYAVLYSDDALRGLAPVSINAREMPLETFLAKLLKPASLSYRIDGTSIFIKRERQNAVHRRPLVEIPEETVQQRAVDGTVVDDSGQPLAGVIVAVKGTPNVAITDNRGNFSIVLPEQ